MSPDTDVDLVRRFREQGDRRAFDALVERHEPWVRRVCRRFLRSDHLAADATQDVFARALGRLETFRGDNFAGWLKAIAVNCCLTIIDREKRWAPLDAARTAVSEAPGPEAQVLRSERTAQATRLIERLSERQKIVFCLKYIDDCSYHEIERLTGFSSNEVKSFLQNARRNVENWWRAEEEGSRWPKKI